MVADTVVDFLVAAADMVADTAVDFWAVSADTVADTAEVGEVDTEGDTGVGTAGKQAMGMDIIITTRATGLHKPAMPPRLRLKRTNRMTAPAICVPENRNAGIGPWAAASNMNTKQKVTHNARAK